MKGSHRYVKASQSPNDDFPWISRPNGDEQPVDDPLLSEHRPPDVRLDEVAGRQGCEHRDDEDVPRARGRDSRHVVREREREHRVGDRDVDRHADRPHGDVAVDRLLEQLFEVVERPRVHDLGRERLRAPEGREQEEEQRPQVDDDEPAERRGEQTHRAGAIRGGRTGSRAAAPGCPGAAARHVERRSPR